MEDEVTNCYYDNETKNLVKQENLYRGVPSGIQYDNGIQTIYKNGVLLRKRWYTRHSRDNEICMICYRKWNEQCDYS